MIKYKIYIFVLLSLSLNIIFSCSQIRESAGVNRKSLDEFQAVENPPLVIPPDFSLVSPQQLKYKNIDNIEKDLAQEILFGLDDQNISDENQLSTMSQILSKSDAINTPDTIRDEIDSIFANEMDTKGVFNNNWENEIDVLDAVKESERIRNKIFNNESIQDDKISIKKQKVKNKKKKKFIFF